MSKRANKKQQVLQSTANESLNYLSHEEKIQFQKIGKYLFQNVNYATQQLIDNPTITSSDLTHYIETSLSSGLHPKDLEEAERVHMQDTYGDKWYTLYGYENLDLEE